MPKLRLKSSTRQQIAEWKRRFEARVENGLRACAAVHSQMLLQEVTSRQTTPVGSHRRHGETYKGEIVERSVAGEYPRREFGALAGSIGYQYSRKERCARSGVTEEGMSIFFLEFGHHWISGEKYDRLGMVRLYQDNRELWPQIFKQGFETI